MLIAASRAANKLVALRRREANEAATSATRWSSIIDMEREMHTRSCSNNWETATDTDTPIDRDRDIDTDINRDSELISCTSTKQ